MNDSTSYQEPEPLLVAPEDLNQQTLDAVIESFTQREGTDYGAVEVSLDQKILNIKKKLAKNEVVLVFDPASESLTFLTQSEWQKLKK